MTEAGICNIALTRVGSSKPIDTLNDSTNEAVWCKAFYAQTRDALLQLAPWPFATRRATLAAVEGAERTGWAGVFALPTDCLRPLYLWSGLRRPPREEQPRFEIEWGESASVLLCDLDAPELVYVARVTDTARFSPLFVDALAWGLAAELAMPLAVKESLEQRARIGYERALLRAQAAAGNERVGDEEPEASWIAARGG